MNTKTSRSTLKTATHALMIAVASISLTVAANAADASSSSLKAANKNFYKSLNIMFTGNIAPMISLWSHGNDVTYLGPDGWFLTGWSSVKGCWNEQAAMKLRGKAASSNFRYFMVQGSGIAVVQDIEEVTTDKGLKLLMRATNVYRLENGSWKMVSHHTDKLPAVLK